MRKCTGLQNRNSDCVTFFAKKVKMTISSADFHENAFKI